VQPAEQVLALNPPIGQQRSPVEAASVQNGDLVLIGPTHDDEIDTLDERVGRLEGLELIESGYLNPHRRAPSGTAAGALRLLWQHNRIVQDFALHTPREIPNVNAGLL
jgi:hypothetical protein